MAVVAGSRHQAALAAVSYDEIVAPGAATVPTVDDAPDVDISGIVDSVTGFLGDTDPVLVVASVAVVAVPLLLSTFFLSRPAKPYGSVSAKEVLAKLQNDPDAQLVDIREIADVKAEGSPDLRGLKKKIIQIPFTGSGDEEPLLKKLLTKIGDPSTASLYILDQFDGNSISVAKYLTSNGVKAAYAIKDGAEGPSGWRRNELPWILPRKAFSLDINSLKDVIDSTLGDNSNVIPATLGLAAAAGLGLVVFSEAETALQLLGSAALVQLFVKKLLFAKDREKTLQELQVFLDTKIAPKELVDELKSVGQAYVKKSTELASGDATKTQSPSLSEQVQETVVKSETITVTETAEQNVETPLTSSEEKVTEEVLASVDLPHTTRPLSPYAQFPGLKPPSPPVPSVSGLAPVGKINQEPQVKPEPATVSKSAEEVVVEVPASVDLPRASRPLSPYAQFPGLKPPSSPIPARA